MVWVRDSLGSRQSALSDKQIQLMIVDLKILNMFVVLVARIIGWGAGRGVVVARLWLHWCTTVHIFVLISHVGVFDLGSDLEEVETWLIV